MYLADCRGASQCFWKAWVDSHPPYHVLLLASWPIFILFPGHTLSGPSKTCLHPPTQTEKPLNGHPLYHSPSLHLQCASDQQQRVILVVVSFPIWCMQSGSVLEKVQPVGVVSSWGTFVLNRIFTFNHARKQRWSVQLGSCETLTCICVCLSLHGYLKCSY